MITKKVFRREVTHIYVDLSVRYYRGIFVPIRNLGDLYKSRITYKDHKYDGKLVFNKRYITSNNNYNTKNV